MSPESLTIEEPCAVRVHLFGYVQGLGVRPAGARLATRLGLSGTAENTPDGVAFELEGTAVAIRGFIAEISNSLPSGAVVERMEVSPKKRRRRRHGFTILDRRADHTTSAETPRDRVVCADCLSEIHDARDHRHEYPLTSCVACGPRYTIIESMPYDRPATSMRHFTMCSNCEVEYRSPADRRFHAQSNACPKCGPQIRLVDSGGRVSQGMSALRDAFESLRGGRVLALKGVGGYQLLVDATSAESVRRLRIRKQRPAKPLAVLVRNLAEAEQLAELNETERKLLVDPGGPIVVVRCRAATPLAADIAPGFHSVGLMLPTTPLHALLCERTQRPLICTSGNREGEPLAFEERAAEQQLAGVADVWLHHDRPIVRPIDDTVVRVVAGQPCFLRLARGFAPHVLPLPRFARERQLIACGGEQKSAIAVWNGSQGVLGPHVGDLGVAATCERWVQQLELLSALYGVELDKAEAVHDRHPDYFASIWSRRFRRSYTVQHHHAHVAAAMLEHGLWDCEVVGLSWDGAGYGDDGAIWGGECLRATSYDFQRIACLRPFPLLGGELAIRQPWRLAVALVSDALGPEIAAQLMWPDVEGARIRSLIAFKTKPRLSVLTSSMGRLFDAVAALALGIASAEEGLAAMLLEQACDRSEEGSYPLIWNRATAHIDWRPLIVAVVKDRNRGVSPGAIAMRFHRAVAEVACSIATDYSDLPLVTAGGVFQNAVLGDLLDQRLANRSAGWYRPITLPPGDGGLAAGQLAVAAARIQRNAGEY